MDQRYAGVLLGCLALAFGALAQTTGPTAHPDAPAILAAMREAAGGANWSRVRSLHIVADLSADGRQAKAERWEDVGTGRYLTRNTWPSYTIENGFDGITPWRQGRSRIAYALGDTDSFFVAADEAFRVSRAWWFPDRHPATIAWAGTREEGARRFDVLEITPEGGRMFQAWIDATTHLLDRTIEEQAEEAEVTRYADYRSVQGLVLPFVIRTGDGSDPAYDEVMHVSTVGVNEAMPDALYDLPPRPPSDIMLPAGQDSVEVPLRLTADNRILVPLTLNAKRTVEAEFDSGGNLLIQPATLASLRVTGVGTAESRGGGEGATSATLGRLDSVAIGGASVRDVSFHSRAFAPDEPDRALVGLEILQRFVVHLDFDRSVMTLTRPDASTAPDRGTTIPFHIQDNQPEVTGTIDGIAGRFAVDTGDGGSLLLIAPFARRYGLVARYHADIPYQGKSTGDTYGVWARLRAGTVALDGADGRPAVQVHAPVTRISLQHSGFDASRTVSANIGLGILKQFNLTFDYTRQTITFERNHLYGQKDVFNRAGLRLKRAGDHWTVAAVYPDSPASQAGLHAGDTVSGIDGQTTAALDADGLWRKLTGPVGAVLNVDLTAPKRHVALALRDLL